MPHADPIMSLLGCLARSLLLLLLLITSTTLRAQWAESESMATPRSEISAALLDGQLYVVGGIGWFRTLRSCERLNLASQRWSECPPLPRPLHHVALAADAARVYAAGGYRSLTFRHDPNPALWSFMPGDQAWQLVAPLPTPIGEHSLVLANEELLLIGGRTPTEDSAAVWIFDRASNEWRARTPMPTARHSMVSVVIDHEVWVLGGRSAALGSAIDRVEVYTPASDRWRSAPSLPAGGGGLSAAVHCGRLHVFGGEVFDPDAVLNRHDVFEPNTQRWLQAPLAPHARHGGAAVSERHGVWLVGGGRQPGLRTVYSVTGTTQLWREECE